MHRARALETAEAAWTWVLAQTHEDAQGPWVPDTVPDDGPAVPAAHRDSVYEGIGGLAPALAELRLLRPWTDHESLLAARIVERLTDDAAQSDPAEPAVECSLYLGAAGSLAAVELLDPGRGAAPLGVLARELTDGGWTTSIFGAPPAPGNDLLLGNAGIVLALVWHGSEDALALATVGADALVRSARPAEGGLDWKMYDGDRERVMPNYSHGTAGIAAALAVAGRALGRDDLVDVARRGAEHLVRIADLDDAGLRLPLQIPAAEGHDGYSFGWCHGPTGTAQLFGALALAGVDTIGGHSPQELIERCDTAVRRSGLPARTRPGFWDNDGRCCGTAGVLDATLDRLQAANELDGEVMAFADVLAGALVERARPVPGYPEQRCWRFHEHRAEQPDLPPGVGWMQGAAGIAAALWRYARVRGGGTAAASRLDLPDSWWMAPPKAGRDRSLSGS